MVCGPLEGTFPAPSSCIIAGELAPLHLVYDYVQFWNGHRDKILRAFTPLPAKVQSFVPIPKHHDVKARE